MNKWTIKKKASELDEINKQIEELQKRKQQLEEQQKKQQDNNEFGIPDLQRYRNKRDENKQIANNFQKDMLKRYENEYNKKIKPNIINEIIEKINEAIDKDNWHCSLYISFLGQTEYNARNECQKIFNTTGVDITKYISVSSSFFDLYFDKMKEIREIFNNKGYRIESDYQGDGKFYLNIKWNDEK